MSQNLTGTWQRPYTFNLSLVSLRMKLLQAIYPLNIYVQSGFPIFSAFKGFAPGSTCW